MEKPWRALLSSRGLLNLLSSRMKDHQHGVAPPTAGWGLPPQSLRKWSSGLPVPDLTEAFSQSLVSETPA